MSIHIEDLTVRFKNGVTAINHANLNIPNGIFGLLGENGAGKTTLLKEVWMLNCYPFKNEDSEEYQQFNKNNFFNMNNKLKRKQDSTSFNNVLWA